jgi:hypothetical protein
MYPLVLAAGISLFAAAAPATAACANEVVCKKELVPDTSGRSVVWGRVCIDRATLEARERQQREIERSRQYLNGVNGPVPNSEFGPTNYVPSVSIPAYVAPPNPSR